MGALLSRVFWGIITTALITGCVLYIYATYIYSVEFTDVVLLAIAIFCISESSKWALLPDHVTWRDWWWQVAAPASIGTFEGQTVLVRSAVSGVSHFYDSFGNLVGTEINIPGDPPYYRSSQMKHGEGYRLSWLARLRSPKLSRVN